MFETSTFAPIIGSESLPLQKFHVELNIGEHAFSTRKGLQAMQERFYDLRMRLETHLSAGGKAVYLREAADITKEQAQRVDALLTNGVTRSPIMAMGAIYNNVDHLPPSEWPYFDFEYLSFSGIEMHMVDDFSRYYPDQFLFKLESGSEQRVKDSYQGVSFDDVRQGKFAENLPQFKEYIFRFISTQQERDVTNAEHIHEIIKSDDPTLFVVATFGANHGSEMSHQLLMRGILSNTIEYNPSTKDKLRTTLRSAIKHGEDVSNLHWIQEMIASAWVEDGFELRGKEADEYLKIVNGTISTCLQTEEDIKGFESKIREKGWMMAIFELYDQWKAEIHAQGDLS